MKKVKKEKKKLKTPPAKPVKTGGAFFVGNSTT
jgi:hypothetical protein